ncbi:hypothetical protein QOT17_009789 [Balamuthia mandrillaris]
MPFPFSLFRDSWHQELYRIWLEEFNKARSDRAVVATLRETNIVFATVGELSFFISGKEDMDELALEGLLNFMVMLLREITKSTDLEEKVFSEKFAKISQAIDEVFALNGMVEQLNIAWILGMESMNPEESRVRAMKEGMKRVAPPAPTIPFKLHDFSKEGRKSWGMV